MKMKHLDEIDRSILAIAKTLFLEQGIRKTEMKDIAAQAQIGRSTLYRRFPSKEILSFYIAVDILCTLDNAVPSESQKNIPTCKNGYEKFASFSKAYVSALTDHIPEIRFLDEFDQIFTDRYPDEEMSSLFRNANDIESSYGTLCLEEGVHDGSIRLNSSPQYMMNLFTQSVMGAAQRILPREAHYIEEHGYGREFLFSLVDLFLAGIQAKS
jgi:AcrR family transcriptional regulator